MGALSKIEAAGFTVSLVNGFIVISNSSSLINMQRQYIKIHKAEIISELEARALSTAVHQKLLDYMAAIGEKDQTMVNEFLDRCKRDAEALSYFLQQADIVCQRNKYQILQAKK